MKTIAFGLGILFLILPPAFAMPADSIGHIQTLKGTALVIRGNTIKSVKIGEVIYQNDLVRTSKDGSVGIVLADDTTLSLGPGSEFAIKNYAFDPKKGKFALLAKMVKGTFVYLSGLIGKLAPDSIRLELPDATIAVRGTKLLIEVEG